MNKDYNTQRSTLILKEYGRNVQKLVNFVRNTEDKEKRNTYARTLVDLMKQISPNLKDNLETSQKLWDDMFIMADFDIDVDSPFPIPKEEILHKKPQRMTYSTGKIRYKHYGKNLELMIKKAAELEDEEERNSAAIYLGRLMKSFHMTWNRDNLEDQAIIDTLRKMSSGVINLDPEKIQAGRYFEMNVRTNKNPRRERDNRDNKRGRNNQNRRRRN